VRKTLVVIQSNYIPWKGYFDLINLADECILLDDVQFTKNDWRNRNRIKTPRGLIWLTIPVKVKGHLSRTIRQTEVADPGWQRRHWKSIAYNYARAAYFPRYAQQIEALYAQPSSRSLSSINRCFIQGICELLGIRTPLFDSDRYATSDDRNARLIDLCRQSQATDYLTGPAARAYLDEAAFEQHGIHVRYMDYSGYPEYPQLGGPFEHGVSILDLILNVGPDAPRFMKSFG
jgi:hypothetical protein